jgi:outer membrane lipoprotein-sorting protein
MQEPWKGSAWRLALGAWLGQGSSHAQRLAPAVTRRQAPGAKRRLYLAPSAAFPALLAACGVAWAATPPLSARFEVVTMEQGPGGQVTVTSKVWVKGNKVRVEAKHPFLGDMNLIADGKNIYQIAPAQKQAMKADQSKTLGGREPWQMFVANVDQLRQKAQKIGSERVEGHLCDIYLRQESEGGNSRSVRAWITRTLKPAMPLKVVTRVSVQRPNASITQTTTVRLRKVELNVALADSLFVMPAGYKVVEGTPTLPGGTGAPGTP